MLAEAPTPVVGTVTELLSGGRFRVRIADGTLLFAVASAELANEATIATGDRVGMVAAEGTFPGVIVRIDPPVAPPTPSSAFSGRSNRVSLEKLKIDRAARPDWPTGAERTPAAGEEVYCTEGLCSVIRVLGRTGNGSRLLELRLEDGDRRPFFAAGSNVLVHPTEPEPISL